MVESIIRYNDKFVPSWEEQQAQKRPANFEALSPQQQWAIDMELGILDWDGS